MQIQKGILLIELLSSITTQEYLHMHRMDFIDSVHHLTKKLNLHHWARHFEQFGANGVDFPHNGETPELGSELFVMREKYLDLRAKLPPDLIKSLGLEFHLGPKFLSAVANDLSTRHTTGQLLSGINFSAFKRFVESMVFLDKQAVSVLRPTLPEESDLFDSMGKTALYFRLLSEQHNKPLNVLAVADFLSRLDRLFELIARHLGLEYEGAEILFVDSGSPLDWIIQVAPEIIEYYQKIAPAFSALGKVYSVSGKSFTHAKKAYLWVAQKLTLSAQEKELARQLAAQRLGRMSFLELDPQEQAAADFSAEYQLIAYDRESKDKASEQKHVAELLSAFQSHHRPRLQENDSLRIEAPKPKNETDSEQSEPDTSPQ